MASFLARCLFEKLKYPLKARFHTLLFAKFRHFAGKFATFSSVIGCNCVHTGVISPFSAILGHIFREILRKMAKSHEKLDCNSVFRAIFACQKKLPGEVIDWENEVALGV